MMNYISPIQYAETLNSFRGNYTNIFEEESIVPELEVDEPLENNDEPKRATIKELMANLTPEDREQLKEYADSLVEIKKEIRKLLTKAKSGGRVEEVGGDMMHKRLNISK